MKRLCYVLAVGLLTGCSALNLSNEDAGHSILASDVTVPANGQVIYTIDRRPRTDAAARQYSQDNNVSRSLFSYFTRSKGTVRTGGNQYAK